MKFKTFWACTGCDKIYNSQRWGFKHLVTAHDGCFYLEEFSPELQLDAVRKLRIGQGQRHVGVVQWNATPQRHSSGN